VDITHQPTTHILLTDIHQLPDGKSAGFSITIDKHTLELFVVNFRGCFYAYENHCPHTGVNLNWQTDQFLDITEQRIQCSTHGALFRINDGLCEWGPCVGQSLRAMNVLERGGQLLLRLDA